MAPGLGIFRVPAIVDAPARVSAEAQEALVASRPSRPSAARQAAGADESTRLAWRLAAAAAPSFWGRHEEFDQRSVGEILKTDH